MRGATLLEVLSVLAIVAILTAIAIPPASRGLDRAAASAAADRYAALFEAARSHALASARFTRLVLDTAQVRATLLQRDPTGTWDSVRTWSLGEVHVGTSQPVVTFSPIGIGWGASNARVVFARGAAAETLTVARTGRLKRW